MAAADVSITSRPYSHDPSALDASRPLTGRGQAPDDLDDLFNYDAIADNVLGDVQETPEQAAANTRKRRQASTEGDGLGIDEEIKIKKARLPQAKLDEERLLSQNGIPKLRTIAKQRLKFRGKGHEFGDVQRLLNTYQLWLDDLFPKAKFADGLAIIEKLGHKKRIKVMRQEWIDEDKPKPVQDISDDEDFVPGMAARGSAVGSDPVASEQQREAEGLPSGTNAIHIPDDEEEFDDEFLYGRPNTDVTGAVPLQSTEDIPPDEDELDMLLAEDATRTQAADQPLRRASEPAFEDYADDEEAMAGMW